MSATFPSELQLDVLREVANIGCGHAANALSRLVGDRAVRIDVPLALAAPDADLVDLLGGDCQIVAVALDVEGELRGRMLLAWPLADAHVLTGLLLGAQAEGSILEDPRRSALSEVANILGSACLSGIAGLTRLRLLPSTPALMQGSVAEVIAALRVRDAEFGRAAVVLKARFIADHAPPLTGQLLILPSADTLPTLFGALPL
jgi:chemotaxis protein CheC